jgi:hypothetical protein
MVALISIAATHPTVNRITIKQGSQKHFRWVTEIKTLKIRSNLLILFKGMVLYNQNSWMKVQLNIRNSTHTQESVGRALSKNEYILSNEEDYFSNEEIIRMISASSNLTIEMMTVHSEASDIVFVRPNNKDVPWITNKEDYFRFYIIEEGEGEQSCLVRHEISVRNGMLLFTNIFADNCRRFDLRLLQIQRLLPWRIQPGEIHASMLPQLQYMVPYKLLTDTT